MLKISKKTSYGLQTLLYLGQANKVVSVTQIAQAEKIPQSFLEQIIHSLRKSGLVKAKRGASGGYQLAKPLVQISLGDLYRSLEDDVFLIECLSDAKTCPHFQNCNAKTGWQLLQTALLNTMDNIKLSQLLATKDEPPIYLDYAATTPVDPRVLQTMQPYFLQIYGNPASMHWAGQQASDAVEEARTFLAQAIGATAPEIIFTSSASESNNLALKGVALASKSKRKKIIISAIEHDCVLNSAQWLATQGFELVFAPVDQNGVLKISEFKKLLDENTLLVSLIHASNEIGSIQPIQKVGQLCQQAGALFHVDASQSFTKLPINVKQNQIDLLTTSSHKIYGPKGVGFLYKRQGVRLAPLIHGGGQEFKVRASTLNVPGIVGFAQAARIAFQERAIEAARIEKLRDKLIKQILLAVPHSYLNGHPKDRLYNNVNFRFEFIEGESLVLGLDLHGIAVSTGSACSSPKLEPSHVLLAIGLKPAQAQGSLRITLGRWTTEQEIDQLIKILPTVVTNLRAISPFKP